MSYRLFTTYYAEPNEARRAELHACLECNCSVFDATHVLCEGIPSPIGTYKLIMETRPRYADLLKYAREYSQAGDIVVIANSDVIIPLPAVHQAVDWLRANDACWALTRWDITTAGIKLFDAVHSQDSWWFYGPPREHIGGDYHFGIPGCDNKLAHELDAAGYKVLNPSKSIRTYHLHLTGHRPGNTAANRVPLPYLFVSPHKLGEQPQYRRPKFQSNRPSQFQR